MEPNHRAPQGNSSADRRSPTADQRPPTADRRPPTEDEPEGVAWKGALAVALVVGGLVVWRACFTAPEDAESSAPAPSGAASAAPA
ncbi:hypothetical protein BE11_50370, partial [Sorangium cellulosum]